jgi:hypothetical protein
MLPFNNIKNDIYISGHVHAFGSSTDNIDEVIQYSSMPTTTVKLNNFTRELKHYIEYLQPKQIIKDKINKFFDKINFKLLGLHIRSQDGGFIEIYNEKKLINFIDNFIINNRDWKIYLSTDNKDIEDLLINKYPEVIIKLDDPFGKDYSTKFKTDYDGLMNSIYEMYVLSKCDKLIGSASSSFSLCSYLLSGNDTLEFWNEQP